MPQLPGQHSTYEIYLRFPVQVRGGSRGAVLVEHAEGAPKRRERGSSWGVMEKVCWLESRLWSVCPREEERRGVLIFFDGADGGGR